MNRILDINHEQVRVPGGRDAHSSSTRRFEPLGRYYPPAPTFLGAFLGGTVATNAAGAATFKYGTTRDWVRALTVVLPGGDVLDVERGTHLRPQRRLLRGSCCAIRQSPCPIPSYRMPGVPKVSAGIFLPRRHVDLIDLFVSAEGTLGIITGGHLARAAVTARDVPAAFVPFRDRTSRARVR